MTTKGLHVNRHLASTARILYVSDSTFLPSILTDHFSFALSPLNSASMSSTSGMRQLRRFPWGPAKCSANLLSQFTTATRPSGNRRENVAPRTWYDTCWAGVLEPVVLVEPLQFTLLPLPKQFTFVFEFEVKYPGTTYV